MRLTRTAGALLAGSMALGALGFGSWLFSPGVARSGPFGGTGQSGVPAAYSASLTMDVASIAAGAVAVVQIGTPVEFTVRYPVSCSPETALETGLVVAYSHMEDGVTFTFALFNATGAPIDPASNTWQCTMVVP